MCEEQFARTRTAPLCSGLARRPLKAVARVRIPSGLQKEATAPRGGFAFCIPDFRRDSIYCGDGRRRIRDSSTRYRLGTQAQ